MERSIGFFCCIFYLVVLFFAGVNYVYAGTLSNFSYSANSYVANTNTDYTFNFTNETDIPATGVVAHFSFDGSFDLSNATATVSVDGVLKNLAAPFYSGSDAYIYIDSDIPVGSAITVTLHNVANAKYSGSYNFNYINNDSDSVVSIDPIIINISPAGSIDAWGTNTLDTIANIVWNADPALINAVVQYGKTESYGQNINANPGWSVDINGLTPSTTYNFRVIMDDGNGHFATSSNQTFTTMEPFFAGGDGSVGSPFQINSCIQLQNIAAASGIFLNKNFILTDDVDCSATNISDSLNPNFNSNLFNNGAGFTPIGSVSPYFSGTFNGQGHVISNLFENSSEFFAGLFSQTNGAVIKNFGLLNENITGSNSVGGVVGYNVHGQVVKVFTKGNITGGSYTGGLVGFNDKGHIENTYSTANIHGTNNVGGLVGESSAGGYPFPTSVVNSYATGNVTGEDYVGGLIGRVNNDPISNSFSTGLVVGLTSNVGGLIGELDGQISYLDSMSNLGWFVSPSGPTFAIGNVDNMGTSTNVTYNILSGGGDGYIDGDQTWFYDKTKDIFTTTLNSEPLWDFSSPVWYGHSDNYPDFVAPVVSINLPVVSVGPRIGPIGGGRLVATSTQDNILKHGQIALFLKDLKLGLKDLDVMRLQKFLNNKGFLVSKKGAGSLGYETNIFGQATRNALIKFQEANAVEILKPSNLIHGTGNFFKATRSFVNALLMK